MKMMKTYMYEPDKIVNQEMEAFAFHVGLSIHLSGYLDQQSDEKLISVKRKRVSTRIRRFNENVINPIMKEIEEYGSRLMMGSAFDHIRGKYFSAEFAISLMDGSCTYPTTTNITKRRIIAKRSFKERLMIIPTIKPRIKGIIMGNIHAYSAGIRLSMFKFLCY
jgi:hypothetical protein